MIEIFHVFLVIQGMNLKLLHQKIVTPLDFSIFWQKLAFYNVQRQKKQLNISDYDSCILDLNTNLQF